MATVPLQAGVREGGDGGRRGPAGARGRGGEDYELLCCLPEGSLDPARAAVADVGGSLTVIGHCVPGEGGGVKLSAPSGRELRVRGYDQLTRRQQS